MENEKLEILNMIRDKAITPEEGLKLLDAIQKENVKFVFEEAKQKKDKKTDVNIIVANSDGTTKSFNL